VKLLSAEFVTSIAEGSTVRTEGLPALALVGRSNVGKSSLINALVKRRLARSGSKPGTTRLLNLYRVATAPPRRRTFMLIDLPGYGYARGGAKARQEFDTLTAGFFRHALTPRADTAASDAVILAGVMLIMDARHPGLESDVAAYRWAETLTCPSIVVTTKADRMSKTELLRTTRAHGDVLGREVLSVSTKTGQGLGPVWTEIWKMLRGLL